MKNRLYLNFIFALLILTFPLNAFGESLCCQAFQKEISKDHNPCHNDPESSKNAPSACQNICIFCVNLSVFTLSECFPSNFSSGLEQIIFASSINSRSIKPPLRPPKEHRFL